MGAAAAMFERSGALEHESMHVWEAADQLTREAVKREQEKREPEKRDQEK